MLLLKIRGKFCLEDLDEVKVVANLQFLSFYTVKWLSCNLLAVMTTGVSEQ